jgi:hypothetical protein
MYQFTEGSRTAFDRDQNAKVIAFEKAAPKRLLKLLAVSGIFNRDQCRIASI